MNVAATLKRTLVARLLRGAARRLRLAGLPLLATILVTQLVIAVLVLPINQWLFREALRSVGHAGLDLGAPLKPAGIPFTLALIVVIALVAFWAMAAQFTLLTVMLDRPGRRRSARELWDHVVKVLRKMFRPSATPLFGYLFIVLPLTGFGFTSLLAQGVSIPPFISGELEKTAASSIVLSLLALILAYINVRFALTVPQFVLTTVTGGRATRLSFRLTRGLNTQGSLIAAVAIVVTLAGAVASVVFAISLLPTLLADTIAPAAAPPVAAVSLGIAQVIGLLLAGLATAAVAAVTVQALAEVRGRIPGDVRRLVTDGEGAETDAVATAGGVATAGPTANARAPRPGLLAGTIVLALAAAAVSTGAGWSTMHRLHAAPDTLVLAHRGFSDHGVENTIGGLEAAAAAGADLVEMDVMETKDHRFVVMHDADLTRLAGKSAKVADLTFDELVGIPVSDRAGNMGTIPSLAEYLQRADELGMPLLVEIKLGGNDSPDHVERLIAEMEDLGVLDNHVYHSLDAASVNKLKRLRPDLTVGYTMAFAAVEAPRTSADMIVVEQWTATERIQRSAQRNGLGFLVWTVNDTPSMRDHLRRGTNGIVTDHPDAALRLREEMREHTGLAAVLFDALGRFVTLG